MGYSIDSLLFSVFIYNRSHFNIKQQAKEEKKHTSRCIPLHSTCTIVKIELLL